MISPNKFLPKEVTALVHHVELNRAGWWEKTVHRLVLAAVWLSENPPTTEDIERVLEQEFHLSISSAKLSSTITILTSQGMLLTLPNGSIRIPDKSRGEFEKQIADADRIASDTRNFFLQLAGQLCKELDPKSLWTTFENELLGPLIRDAGANAYRLIAGERMAADRKLVDRFLSNFDPSSHQKLNELVTRFLDPKNEPVRAYVTRTLHACFCVEASGLPASALQNLTTSLGKQVSFRVFVDTNFLFSLLALHENPSNAAANELRELIERLKANPRIDLFVTPRTIQEAKTSIEAAKFQLSGIPPNANITNAALQLHLSGMAERFLIERLRRGGKLSTDEWFDPYLKDFVPVARAKGVELCNEKQDAYATRQDVIDDISLVMKFEQGLPANRRKSYEKVAHDMILWHFVRDKRPAYVESPIDAQEWILTVDYRLIGFDEHKQKRSGAKVPICLHPTSLIQLLQFWVPRSKEFEEAILGSLRLPFLLQDFDVEAERTSLKILRGLGRFEGAGDLSEETLTRVILNDGLRSRLKTEDNEQREIALIRDALLEEIKLRADAEVAEARQLSATVKERDAALAARDEELAALQKTIAEGETRSITAHETLAAQSAEINILKSKWQSMQDANQRRLALACYSGLLVTVISISGLAAWQAARLFPWYTKIIGLAPTRGLAALLAFVVGHLLLELWAKHKPIIGGLWPFRQAKRFRRRLWALVVLGFALGVFGNLYANRIQKNLDQDQQPTPPSGTTSATNSTRTIRTIPVSATPH